jgi:hypothetical protein
LKKNDNIEKILFKLLPEDFLDDHIVFALEYIFKIDNKIIIEFIQIL